MVQTTGCNQGKTKQEWLFERLAKRAEHIPHEGSDGGTSMSNRTGTEVYTPDDTRPLSDAVLDAINHQTKKDLQKGDFRLYDHVNPDALDQLFHPHADARVTAMFNAGDLLIILHGNKGIHIHVQDKNAAPPPPLPL
jgi:Halobacterial output domain 1